MRKVCRRTPRRLRELARGNSQTASPPPQAVLATSQPPQGNAVATTSKGDTVQAVRLATTPPLTKRSLVRQTCFALSTKSSTWSAYPVNTAPRPNQVARRCLHLPTASRTDTTLGHSGARRSCRWLRRASSETASWPLAAWKAVSRCATGKARCLSVGEKGEAHASFHKATAPPRQTPTSARLNGGQRPTQTKSIKA